MADDAHERWWHVDAIFAEALDLDNCSIVMAEDRSEALIALDEALEQLASRDAKLAQVVECRFFGGLTTKETAEVMEVSARTTERLWNRAKTYLYLALSEA